MAKKDTIKREGFMYIANKIKDVLVGKDEVAVFTLNANGVLIDAKNKKEIPVDYEEVTKERATLYNDMKDEIRGLREENLRLKNN